MGEDPLPIITILYGFWVWGYLMANTLKRKWWLRVAHRSWQGIVFAIYMALFVPLACWIFKLPLNQFLAEVGATTQVAERTPSGHSEIASNLPRGEVLADERPKTQETTETTAWESVALFTAYNSTVAQCGKADGITASGKAATENHTLACPKQYPFGTKIEIEGVGVRTCEDRGGAIKGEHFDLYFGGEEKLQEAKQWGNNKKLSYRVID